MADLAVFDPRTVTDRSTFANPRQDSEGKRFVAVNGQLVIDEGRITDARPGLTRGPGFRRPAPGN